MSLLSIPVLGCIILFFVDHQLAQSLPGAAKSLLACRFSSSLAWNPTRALLVFASFFRSFNSVQVCVWKASYHIPCLVWSDPSHIQFVSKTRGLQPFWLGRRVEAVVVGWEEGMVFMCAHAPLSQMQFCTPPLSLVLVANELHSGTEPPIRGWGPLNLGDHVAGEQMLFTTFSTLSQPISLFIYTFLPRHLYEANFPFC